MENHLTKELNKLSEIEIESLLKSNCIERQLRKDIYCLYIMKRTERLIIQSIPLIANIGIAAGITGIIQQEVNKILKE